MGSRESDQSGSPILIAITQDDTTACAAKTL
jgi:hypothetical protein